MTHGGKKPVGISSVPPLPGIIRRTNWLSGSSGSRSAANNFPSMLIYPRLIFFLFFFLHYAKLKGESALCVFCCFFLFFFKIARF